MADLQHTALAKKGPHAIGRWREQRRWVRRQLDLSGAMLSRARLIGADLARDNLSRIDLTGADLHLADLSGANLRGAQLFRSNLSRTDLREANLTGASLVRANLSGSCLVGVGLRGADLSFADLSRADLEGANLSGANLSETNFSWANLGGAVLRNARMAGTVLDLADLTGADLRGAGLIRCVLHGTLLGDVLLEMTLFGDCDLSQVMGLEQVRHAGPSIIGVDSLDRSGGLIPDVFLRLAGVADSLIAAQEHLRSCRRSHPRVLLVSSVKDSVFAGRVQEDLRASGMLCWSLVIDDEDAFQAQESALKRASYYDCLALVCSGNSLENPHGSRFFAELTRNGATASAQSILPLGLDDLLFRREDQVCSALRRHPTVDFRGWERQEVYRHGLAGLVAALD